MGRIARTAGLLLVVATLAGCAVTTSPSTSPTTTGGKPTSKADARPRIEMGPRHTIVKDAAGATLATVTYDEDPRTVVADLTAALGAPPTPGSDPSDADPWGMGWSTQKWGGLVLDAYEGGPGARVAGWSVFSLTVSTPEVDGFAVEGPSDVTVGDARSDIASTVDTSDDPTFTVGGKGELPLARWTRPGENPDGSGRLTDWIVAGTESGRVTYLRATEFDYGS